MKIGIPVWTDGGVFAVWGPDGPLCQYPRPAFRRS